MFFYNLSPLTPVSRSLRVLGFAPLMLVSNQAWSETVDGVTKDIDSTYVRDEWRVINGGVLNVNGARTDSIEVTSNSTLNVTGAQISGSGLFGAAVDLRESTGNISGSSISGGGEAGIRVTRSNLTLTGSSVSGTEMGIDILAGSTVAISGSQVSGTGTDGVGIHMFNGTLQVNGGSVISGTVNGIHVTQSPPSAGAGNPYIELDNSQVVGQTGAAIVVDPPFGSQDSTHIVVKNGSSLVGGNGNILEVNGATARMDVAGSTLEGNVQVRDSANLDLNLDQSSLTGDVIAEAGSTANVALSNNSVLTGRLENLNSLAINSAAKWVMVEDSSISNLAMNGGFIKMGEPDAFYRLSVGNLSGNGTFVMDADFSQGKVDFLDVTGTATGNHSLLVGATGADPLADSSLHVVHTASGDAQFSLLNGPVDMGTYTYELTQQGGNDWYLVNTGKVSSGTRAVLALFNTAPTVWYGELSTLRSRMGELRFKGVQPGGWIRGYGNKFDAKAASGVGYQQTQQGISFGADAPLPWGDGQWLVGLLGGYSKSDLNLARGTTGQVSSYYVGAYTTWLDQSSGYYFDGVLKFNRFRNEADVSMSDGSETRGEYDNSGVGASLEFGKHIKLDAGYFVEPYTQLAGVMVQGRDYSLDNGMQADGDVTRSLIGKLGATAGRDFDLGAGRIAQPYVRAAYVHEFSQDNGVKVNNNVFNNDLSGSRGELGVGVAVSMSDQLQLHADFDYSNGRKLEQPWGANIGLRYSW
ncbi:autotransporter outer membrane beta-barrel domain-containing protein [Pseudomonas cichorii]|nr:autotransporter outer membrane beta-barrel domain-containing protein [Pseudomonas cichorii]MBX8512954.1 autotransporter outer membrane beta-barrel domain-containing protein [Pseudomonas cichorii]MBX8527903.1 autotransporter outer membrane beta-barrel domain-containing protein [Pseudomonas cichorii]